jgi:flavorubredoxin
VDWERERMKEAGLYVKRGWKEFIGEDMSNREFIVWREFEVLDSEEVLTVLLISSVFHLYTTHLISSSTFICIYSSCAEILFSNNNIYAIKKIFDEVFR